MISFCVTAMGRYSLFTNCVRSLANLRCDAELIVAQWPSNEVDPLGWVQAAIPYPVTCIPLTGKFSRGRGLNVAAAWARGTVLFFIDTDMLLGSTVVHDAQAACQAGHGFFPVCWSFRDAEHTKGYWRTEGHGITAVTRQLFEQSGRWDEFTQWGGEDRKFHERVQQHAQIWRRPYADLIHQWHPVTN